MQRLQSFEELNLRLRPDGQGAYRTQVVRSPYGCRDVPFDLRDLGFSLESISESLASAVWAGVATARDLGNRPAPRRQPRFTPQQIGDALFRALFRDDLPRTFLLCLGRIESLQGFGLRVRLDFDPTDPESRKLIALPWELLYRSETRDFLSRNPLTPVVRYLEVPRLTSPAALGSHLRILVALANPRDTATLDLKRECFQLKETLGCDSRIEVQFLEHPTTATLRAELQGSEFHVFHYIGHGGLDGSTGEGFLLFEDSQGYSQPVPGAVLGEVLKGSPTLRLIFLNACRTAQIKSDYGDPFAMLASALALAGLPAVTAMQLPISDSAALLFSQKLYEALVLGFTIDAAVSEARLAIHLANPHSLEWAVPVLYMSVPDGRILLPFDTTMADAKQKSPPPIDPQEIPKGNITVADHGTVGGADGVTLGGSGYVVQGGIRFGRSTRNEPK